MHFDGLLYVLVAVHGYLATQLGTDTAAAIFSERNLYVIQTLNGVCLQAWLALKLFRSTIFSEWKKLQPANGKNGNGSHTEVTETTSKISSPEKTTVVSEKTVLVETPERKHDDPKDPDPATVGKPT